MHKISIGGVAITAPAVMAPIAGMTDLPFRKLVMAAGAGLAVSELISANALVRDSGKTWGMLPQKEETRPVAAQLFGGQAEVIRDAAVMVAESGRCDIIDLNFGCPVKKVTKCGAGAAGLRDPEKVATVVAAVASAISLPVTIKIRIGWDSGSVNAVDVAKSAEQAGAAAIAVHGRTASQGYSGEADWDVIAEVAKSVKIPVIGNGDITTPEQALDRLASSGCSLVMIGRGALGAPWLFGAINALHRQETWRAPGREEKGRTILRHLDLMITHYGEMTAVRKMRAHLGYYTRGLHGAARFRERANQTPDAETAKRLIEEYFTTKPAPSFPAAAGWR